MEAKICPNCGQVAGLSDPSCRQCGHTFNTSFGNPTARTQAFSTPNSPQSQHPAIRDASSKKLASGLLAILLGTLGIHKFVLGYTTEGVITLLISLVGGIVTCGIASGVMHIIAIIEGVIYLTKSDEEFYWTYIANKKAWF